MRRKPGMVLIILTMMTFVLSGCQSDEITGEEVTLEEEALQEGKGSGEEQADGESQEQREGAGKEQTGRTDEGKIWVYVCGQVASPGVYELPEESRIYEAVESAGGILEQGAAESVNLAEKASDGQRIYIPSKEEAAAMPAETPDEGSSGGMNDERVN